VIVRIIILVVDLELGSFIRTNKERIIPKEWLTRDYFKERGASLTASEFVISTNKAALQNEISRLRKEAEGVILLYQQEASEDVAPFSSSCFARKLEIGGNNQNMLYKNIAFVLKQFELFSKYFDELKHQQIFLLPFHNFAADEFCDLCRLLTAGGNDFASNLSQLIVKLKRRQRPKRPSKSKKTYYVDDRNFYFNYGHERHAKVGTRNPPHNLRCALNCDFRYGRRYDPDRHFNVSLEADNDLISCIFKDCHGESQPRNDATHVNVFPNGRLTLSELETNKGTPNRNALLLSY
jgi:hypothetical protein